MPVVLHIGHRLKVSIYFKDHNPPHVHVNGPDAEAVFVLGTFECVRSSGFTSKWLTRIQEALIERREFLQEKWDELKG